MGNQHKNICCNLQTVDPACHPACTRTEWDAMICLRHSVEPIHNNKEQSETFCMWLLSIAHVLHVTAVNCTCCMWLLSTARVACDCCQLHMCCMWLLSTARVACDYCQLHVLHVTAVNCTCVARDCCHLHMCMYIQRQKQIYTRRWLVSMCLVSDIKTWAYVGNTEKVVLFIVVLFSWCEQLVSWEEGREGGKKGERKESRKGGKR